LCGKNRKEEKGKTAAKEKKKEEKKTVSEIKNQANEVK